MRDPISATEFAETSRAWFYTFTKRTLIKKSIRGFGILVFVNKDSHLAMSAPDQAHRGTLMHVYKRI